MAEFTLSPSDLSFLWDDCPACFWRKVRQGVRRPGIPMPRVFTLLHAIFQKELMGERTEAFVPALPPGTFVLTEKWVQSVPLVVPGSKSTCVIRGRFDLAARFDDASHGIVDIKTAITKEVNVAPYGRQLHGYLFAAESPARGQVELAPVNRLGLFCLEPSALVRLDETHAHLDTKRAWIEVPVDRPGFRSFLGEVLDVLDRETEPDPSAKCEHCAYRAAA